MEVKVTEPATSQARIADRELGAYRAEIKGEIFREIRRVLHERKKRGFTQKELARRLGMDEGFLSRKLKGEDDLQLDTLSDLARGLDCKLEVSVVPLSHPKFADNSDAWEFTIFENIAAPAVLAKSAGPIVWDITSRGGMITPYLANQAISTCQVAMGGTAVSTGVMIYSALQTDHRVDFMQESPAFTEGAGGGVASRSNITGLTSKLL
jgi:transcriptional regulator with XRE-family HTH domain